MDAREDHEIDPMQLLGVCSLDGILSGLHRVVHLEGSLAAKPTLWPAERPQQLARPAMPQSLERAACRPVRNATHAIVVLAPALDDDPSVTPLIPACLSVWMMSGSDMPYWSRNQPAVVSLKIGALAPQCRGGVFANRLLPGQDRAGRHDLAYINAVIRLVEGGEQERAQYIVSHGFFETGEIADICLRHLRADGELDTRQLAERVWPASLNRSQA
jgi:hypothetical protein